MNEDPTYMVSLDGGQQFDQMGTTTKLLSRPSLQRLNTAPILGEVQLPVYNDLIAGHARDLENHCAKDGNDQIEAVTESSLTPNGKQSVHKQMNRFESRNATTERLVPLNETEETITSE